MGIREAQLKAELRVYKSLCRLLIIVLALITLCSILLTMMYVCHDNTAIPVSDLNVLSVLV
jgi:hypothetical protein